ncbi:MAG: (Fe-S)-binding protein [Thermoanaerobaculales bacterium]
MAGRSLLDDCVHCGFCLPTCPTWVSWGEEMDSPRGRIDLMRSLAEGKVTLDANVLRHFDDCLGCMACVTACPSGVKYDVLIEETRARIEREAHRPLADRVHRALIFALFPYPRRLKAMLLPLWLYTQSGLASLVLRSGVLRLLPARMREMIELLPPVRARQLRASLPAITPAHGTRRTRVGLVAGCVQRVFFPEVNEATIRVLAAEGCEVIVPPGQGCCGALSVHAGRADEALAMARRMIATFEALELDAILVNAAGCGSTLKDYGRLLAHDPEWSERAATFAAKVRDITEFLAKLEPIAPRHPLAMRVAYHQACHLGHAQRVVEQPRALLRGIPGLTVLEVPDGDQCCGSAGIYNLVNPASAEEIGERKAERILSTGAEVLASGNPGCTLQIGRILKKQGRALPALHLIEILDASIAGRTLAGPPGVP